MNFLKNYERVLIKKKRYLFKNEIPVATCDSCIYCIPRKNNTCMTCNEYDNCDYIVRNGTKFLKYNKSFSYKNFHPHSFLMEFLIEKYEFLTEEEMMIK